MDEIIKAVKLLAEEEKSRGDALYGKNHSRHESYAVLKEELEECEDEMEGIYHKMERIWKMVKADAKQSDMLGELNALILNCLCMTAEAVQVTAMAMKMHDFEEANNKSGIR